MPYDTPEGLDDNYILKLVRKTLKKEYPYITDVQIDYNDIEKYRTIFLIIGIDLFKMAEYYDVRIMSYVRGYINRNEPFESVSPSVMFDIPYEEGRDIIDEINNTIRKIVDNPVVPKELKNLNNRSFLVGGFVHKP